MRSSLRLLGPSLSFAFALLAACSAADPMSPPATQQASVEQEDAGAAAPPIALEPAAPATTAPEEAHPAQPGATPLPIPDPLPGGGRDGGPIFPIPEPPPPNPSPAPQ